MRQRRTWCLLSVHFNGVDFEFAIPAEIDRFLDVMSRNPLPSGPSLVPNFPLGRPKYHWLASLPKGATNWKFRTSLCKYLVGSPDVRRFREFYADPPLRYSFENVFDNFFAANVAARQIAMDEKRSA
ncbi:hypothetical protein [Rhizobium sp. WYCCWR10014]|uniref:hypothetical protein n=1 Tax=Rhizobium sp. WYCCWR10014 TaxID=1825933 RepID=UPI001FD8D6F9|nr:hypothetical protein [Rhizobium sp. WYCCWR10014]